MTMIVDEVEQKLRPPVTEMKPYPAKYIELKNGDKLVIHEVHMEEVPRLMEVVKPLTHVAQDYYDIVTARIYSELLGWYRYRVKDEFCLVGTVNGEIVGLVNSRMVDDKVGMSYHTLAIRRGGRIGAHLFAAKMEHHLDVLGQDEVWIVAESPNGMRRWMEEYGLEFRPSQWHELGGGPTFVLTKELWNARKAEKCFGTRPVPAEMLEVAKNWKMPTSYCQIPDWKPGN